MLLCEFLIAPPMSTEMKMFMSITPGGQTGVTLCTSQNGMQEFALHLLCLHLRVNAPVNE